MSNKQKKNFKYIIYMGSMKIFFNKVSNSNLYVILPRNMSTLLYQKHLLSWSHLRLCEYTKSIRIFFCVTKTLVYIWWMLKTNIWNNKKVIPQKKPNYIIVAEFINDLLFGHCFMGKYLISIRQFSVMHLLHFPQCSMQLYASFLFLFSLLNDHFVYGLKKNALNMVFSVAA